MSITHILRSKIRHAVLALALVAGATASSSGESASASSILGGADEYSLNTAVQGLTFSPGLLAFDTYCDARTHSGTTTLRVRTPSTLPNGMLFSYKIQTRPAAGGAWSTMAAATVTVPGSGGGFVIPQINWTAATFTGRGTYVVQVVENFFDATSQRWAPVSNLVERGYTQVLWTGYKWVAWTDYTSCTL